MQTAVHSAYYRILESELVEALGCTEPISIAYAAAKAREVLGVQPCSLEVMCSSNIIKNAKSVTVPHSGGRRGIACAALLGALAGDASHSLSVLDHADPACFAMLDKMLSESCCTCVLAQDVPVLYIKVTLFSGKRSAAVEIQNRHDRISCIEQDGIVIFSEERCSAETAGMDRDRELLSVKEILSFAETADLSPVRKLLQMQIRNNSRIARVGLEQHYGAAVGRTLAADGRPETLLCRMKATTAAGSDARMGGCPLPVVINSGSGNQGMTVSLPVIVYAEHIGASEDQLCRALLISNLLSIHQKRFIGPLSAYCGAVCAAAGSGAAITWLSGGSVRQICQTITGTIVSIGGMLCDGAKASCAAKIALAVDAAYTAHQMSLKGIVFSPGDGLVGSTVEETIRNLGRIGQTGMREADREIMSIMREQCAQNQY